MKINKSKKIEHYDFTQMPRRPGFLIYVARFLSKIMLLSRKHKVTYIGKKIERPSLILANHGSFNDFYMMYEAIKSSRINYVIALDTFNDVSNYVMGCLGGIAKRKFIAETTLMKSMRYSVDKLKNNILMYPEARYSLDGTTSHLPDSVGKLAKFLKVPVVMLKLYGCYVTDPQWNKYKDKRIETNATVEEILSKEQVESLSVQEINDIIRKHFIYDDWKFLRESDSVITSKNYANNINAILYQCPNCKEEFNMIGSGTTLTCNYCKKVWNIDNKGVITATTGETEFKYVPDWFKWEKQNVHNEVFSNTYKMEVDCDVYTMPSCKGFVKHKQGKLIQDSFSTTLKVNLYGEDREINYNGNNLESVHVEYNYKDAGDMLDFSIPNDSVWLHPHKKDILTKVSLATEEIRDLAKQNR